MGKDEKDLRKEIEELEKLIEIVKEQHKEEKKLQKKSNKQAPGNVIRIDLAARYSSNRLINLIVSFLVNFILLYAIVKIFKLTEVRVDYIYLLVAFGFTLYEELYKELMIKRYVKLVLYSSGLIFFLMNLIFFYLIDIAILGNAFSFANYLYPIVFVIIFQFSRMFFKTAYIQIINRINLLNSKKS